MSGYPPSEPDNQGNFPYPAPRFPNDPYRAWQNYAETSQKPWMIRMPPADFVWGGIAGEALGLGTSQRFPLRPIDKGGIPLYLASDGTFKAMTSAQVKAYGGILIAAQYAGSAVMRIKQGIVALNAGSDAIVANHMVQCDDTPAYGNLGDVIPQHGVKRITFMEGVEAGEAEIDFATFFPQCWAIKSISAADHTPAGTAEPVNLVVDAAGTGSPAAGHCSYEPADGSFKVKFGTTIAEGDLVTLVVDVYDDCKYPWTVGLAEEAAAARISATVQASSAIELAG